MLITNPPRNYLSLYSPLKVKYFDLPSAALSFVRAFTLVPIWALPFLPVLGLGLIRIGYWGEPVSWLVLIAACVYQYHCVVSSRLVIEGPIIRNGIREFRIAEAREVRLKYDRTRVLPTHLIIERTSGELMELELSRLDNKGLQTILDHIKERSPTCRFDAAIQTIQECRHLAVRANPVVDPNVIPYHGHRHLLDMYRLFVDYFIELVPAALACVSLAAFPIALCVCLGLSVAFGANLISTQHYGTFSWGSYFIIYICGGITSLIVVAAPIAIGAVSWALVKNPFVVAFSSIVAVFTVKHLLQAVFKPNVIAATDQGIELQLRYEDDSRTMASVRWSELCALHLESTDGDIGSDSCRITLVGKEGKNVLSLNLYAIDRLDRERLIAMVKKHAPHCLIDPAVLEAVAMKRSKSYTELWLQSLSRVNTRTNVELLVPGQLVRQERYEVTRRLASGGLGTAYLARDLSVTPEPALTTHNPSVVLKEMFLPAFSDARAVDQAVERFEHEVRILEQINHPGIVKLIDSFVEDHRGYLVLEHIDGLTLKKMVDVHGPVSTERATDLILQMCDILSHLHDRQIIHRDFTPDNLILDSRGRLHLLDFNVAQQVHSGKAGTVVGKHSYLPPEQFRGKATIASDIYAMGATTFYILTGLDPEPITQSRPTDKLPDLDSSLDDFCAAATALSLDKRYKNAAEARDALLGLQRLELSSVLSSLVEQQA